MKGMFSVAEIQAEYRNSSLDKPHYLLIGSRGRAESRYYFCFSHIFPVPSASIVPNYVYKRKGRDEFPASVSSDYPRRPPQQLPAQVNRGAEGATLPPPPALPAAKLETWRFVFLEPHWEHSTSSRRLAITSFSKPAPHSLQTYSYSGIYIS
jgi:hypothetical protein